VVQILENPLRVGLQQERTPEPLILVIFGASGDLTIRKLVPAIYNLKQQRRLPPELTIVGVARRPWSHDYFREQMREGVEKFSSGIGAEPIWQNFAEGLYYQSLDMSKLEDYHKLDEFLTQLDKERGTRGNRVFYLAVSPNFFIDGIEKLGQAGMIKDPNKTRLVIEKPFGRDLASCQELNRVVQKSCDEKQIYRIDHYLGKETVQNLLVLRFANAIFEPLWNRQFIDHIQITVAETVGVEDRAGYYENSGALRDMLQNHLMQLFCLTAMEPPNALDADSLRNEKVKVIQATKLADTRNLNRSCVRAQYSAGWMKGKQVQGYRDEPNVNPASLVPTYVFQSAAKQVSPNVLTLRIQPNEGISLRFEAKMPGADLRSRSVEMDFGYGKTFGIEGSDAYDRLLLDCMLGDQTLFTRGDEVEAAWKVVTPALATWELPNDPSVVPQYAAGTWGPTEAEQLLERDGRQWRRL
jgi:glucose-6-phosphate 1-dehydrogenase